jgi:predicted DCC family thiol-disulfide oxidoreductase YuxK
MESAPTPLSPLIILYDGACGFCDSSVNFVLARDSARRFRFAALQSKIGRELMTAHGLNPDDLNSVILIEAGRVYQRSTAVLRILMELPDPWPLAGAAVFIPEALRDSAYDFVARHRKKWFKTPESCHMPTAEQREQFMT